MPSRGNYEITNCEEGEVAQRDESYKSCVLSMLIFTLLCVVLILASSPWKTFQTRYSRDHRPGDEDSMESARMDGHGFTTVEAERIAVTEKKQTVRSDVPAERYTKDGTTETLATGTMEETSRKFDETSRKIEITSRESETTPKMEATTRKVDTTLTIEATTRKVEETSGMIEGTTRKVEETSPITEGTLRKVEETSAMVEGTIRKIEGTSPTIEGTTRKVEETSAMVEGTTRKTRETSPAVEETTRTVDGTSRSIEGTTRKGNETFPIIEGTTRNGNETSPIIEGTTRKVEETSAIIEGTTRKFGETSAMVEGTTRKIDETSRSIENVEKRISTTSTPLFSPETTTPTIRTPKVSTSFVAKEITDAGSATLSPKTATNTETIELFNGNSSSGKSEKLLAIIEDFTTSPGTTKRSITDYTSLQKLLVAKYFGNESTTVSSKTENWLDEMEDAKKERTDVSSSTTRFVTSSTVRIRPTTEPITTTRKLDKSIGATTRDPEATTPRAIRERNVDVCETGSCKQLASKMLSYMNHSSDPCEDFYEYACGGLQADPQINEKILTHRVYETIEIQARKQKSSQESQLLEYYESCLKYETNFHIDQRIHMAQESLKRIGKFYTRESWPGEFRSITTLFANMLSQNRPVLFDVTPDVNEKNPEAFTLRIGPAVDDNPFRTMHKPDPCEDENPESPNEQEDLDRLYESYRKCRKDSRVTVIALTRALKDIGIFKEFKNTQNESLYLEDTVTNIYHQIIEGVQTYFPSDSEIREAYRSKHYTVATLGELESTCTLLNWTQLAQSLTGLTLGPNTELQIYYKAELTRAMKRLEIFARRNELGLNNALLGLYARSLYRDLVAERSVRDLEKKCFNVAAHFMQAEASALYMSSFSASEIDDMQALIESAFHELRETLRLELKESEWAVGWGREVLLKKIDDMRMSIPRTSRMNNAGHGSRLNITDNYFENSMSLMKKYRSVMYRVLQKDPNDPEQIWTFFASPYQSSPRTIYGLNLIVVPFGAIDWPLLSGHTKKLDYVSFATVGNLVAREIAHNFDTNGIRYWNGSRDSEFALMTDDDSTRSSFEDYISCHTSTIYQDPVEMSLPITGQRLTFRIPTLTLNERLSDAVGMRLAHDTLVRLGNDASEKRLPWLDLDVSQLYYLVYSQTHCTKAYLTSSYIKLYEDPTLPSRVRIFVAASNNKNVGESWNCPEGSQLLPSSTCGVFPHFEYRGIMPDPA